MIKSLLSRYRWLLASLLLVIITPLALGGFWLSDDQWGISDWDYYFSYHESVRTTVLDHGQLPLWNPYICGGTAALGDPEFPLFTPTFLLELIFGVPIGLRLAIFFATAVGAVGMLMLGKRLGLSVIAAFLAALAVAFGSVNLLEIVEGHPNIFAAMYIPWIFWSWLNAYGISTKHQTLRSRQASNYKKPTPQRTLNIGPWKLSGSFGLVLGSSRKWSLICGIFLALTFFQSGIYLLMYTGIAFIVLISLLKHHRTAFLVTITAGLWALGLAALKIIPVLFWLTQFQDAAYASSAFTLPYLHKIFLGRYLHGSENVIPNQGGGWHEYGAYIGPFVVSLALISLSKLKSSRLVRLLTIAAILSILLSSAGPLLMPLFDQAAFLPRSNISRVIFFAIIPLSLLAGIGLDTLTGPRAGSDKKRRAILLGKLLAILIVLIVGFDLLSLSYQLSKQAFVVPPIAAETTAPQPIAYTVNDYTVRVPRPDDKPGQGVDYTRSYANILAGYGSLSYCSVIGPDVSVRAQEHDLSEYFSTNNDTSTVNLVSWSPNRIIIDVTATEPTEVVLNSNYVKGWFVETEQGETLSLSKGKPARDIGNRLAAVVPAGQLQIIFEYRSPGFRSGLAITIITLLIGAFILRKN